MADRPETLLICDCAGTQAPDAGRLSRATGLPCSRLHTALCTAELPEAARAMQDGPVRIACGQEQAVFLDLAEELGLEPPAFVDIRDRAGWTDDPDATPKMAALVAESRLSLPAARTLDVSAEGLCLVLGAPEVALPAAEALAEHLSVTVLMPPGTEGDAPAERTFDIVTGRPRGATGAFGDFRLTIDALRQLDPAGRGAFRFTPPRDGGKTECDLILDLSGATPLFPAAHVRDGYLRADPGDPLAVARTVMAASHMSGTFEKTLHVRLEEHLCAHSRARQVACTRCLDICPTGAITPAGEHVAVDPGVCAGCGGCSAVCPSGAISYDAPPVGTVFQRLRVLAETYRAAGGTAPRLLVHDDTHGAEMIRLAARHGRGLPADVIPLEVAALAAFGHAEMLGAMGCGFSSVDLLLAPRTERDAPVREAALTDAILGAGRVRLLDPADPDALSDALYGAVAAEALATPVLPMGGRREIARLAARALRADVTEPLPLPRGAPYGAVLVDTGACTLCLSCAGLCPSGALGDNPDSPQLLFREDACLQCGLCANICPEDAITLEPRLNLADDALRQQVLKEEEPALCVECGKPFGVASTIERIVAQLEGKHPMFADSERGRMIRMCDDCRVNAQYHSENNPFAGAPRPRVRTSDDYLN